MIKARVIKPFFYDKNKDIYLDKDRFEELKKAGYVEGYKDNDKSDKSKKVK